MTCNNFICKKGQNIFGMLHCLKLYRPACLCQTWHNDVIKSIPSTTSAQLGTSEFLIIADWEKSIKFRFIENKKSDINETGLDVFNNYITTK